MAEIHVVGTFLGIGEEKTADYLSKELPDAWTVIANKEIRKTDGSVKEIDFIVIADNTVFVIEEKNWSGVIYGNENGWILKNRESFFSPISTIDTVAKSLDKILRQNIPLLDRYIKGQFVFGRVLLSSENVQLNVHDPRRNNQVFQLLDSAEEIQRFDKLQRGTISISDFREAIRTSLLGLAVRPNIPKTIRDYTITEMLPSQGSIRSLRALDKTGAERILKLIPQSSKDEKSAILEQSIRLREYQSLQALAKTGVVPEIDGFFAWERNTIWVIAIHPVNGYSLRADRNNAIPHGERMWQVIENAYQSLAAIHQVGIIHRGLTPDRIFISDEGKVVFTDFSLSKIQGALTVADDADLFGKDSNYCAPECKREISLATKSSDLFSLTASILYWLTAIEPPAWGSMLGNIPPEVDKHLGSLLDRCIDEEESKRPPLNEIINRVSNKRKQLQDPRKLRLNQEFLEPGSIITDQYKIVRRLGEGATAVTYLAEDIVADSLFVLKKIKSPELIARLAKTEFKTLATLHHPNLPRIYDIRPANSPFHLKMEYIVGSSLLELMENSIAKTDFCIKIGLQLLSALNYLEQKNILHRDISPGNIVVTDEETVTVKLIDFGLATKDIASTSSVGTPRYRAPEIDKGGNWTTACDIYSLGAVLFELLTGKLPYLFDNFNPRKDSIIELTKAEKEHFDENLLNILLKAVAPDPEKRFKNALDFTAALKHLTSSTSFNIAKQKTSLIIGKRAINHFVNELRGSYRNSKYGNSDNRGLDTEFATSTYVPTRLDTHLLPAILSGKFRLVILSGNPGDGKTAFLQRTRSQLRNLGAVLVEEDPSGWHYRLNNREFAAINDASESHQEKSSDQLLHNILHPLSNTINDKYTAIVAANDGRLLDFFEKYSSQYSWLWNGFREQFLEGKTSYSEVILVDLKRRSLVAYSAQESSFFSAIMAQFVDDRRWEICNSCLAKNDCPIRFNVLSFSDTNLRQSIVSGLHHLIFAVHLQREHRPTVRDLRSALAFLITHDLSCEDIHQELEGQISSLSFSQRLYFNAAFDKRKLPDLLLDQWYHLDPALVANPRLDRFIYFHRQSAQDLESIFTTAPLRPKINQVYTTTQTLTEQYWLATIKRRYFFEGNGHLLDLPETKQLFAYHYYWDFVSALFGKIDEELLLKRLTRGISKIDGVPDSACNNTLSFRINQDSEIAVVKQFPISNFQIGRTFSGLEFTEEVPDQLLLEHKSGFPSLTISLDLFEFISKACEGVLTGAKEQQVLIEDLAIFKNRLLACSTSDVLIIESGKKFSRVKADKGSLKRQEVEN